MPPAAAKSGAPGPEPKAPLEKIAERAAPALYRMTLPNGLVAVIDARPERRTVYCEIGVRVGSRDEPLALAGMSHLLEHLLFKEGETAGAPKNPAFSKIRAAGGDVNAETSFESTRYYCDVHADAFEEGWRGLSNLVRQTAFDAADVETERRVVLQEAALDKNNPVSVAGYSVLGRLFPDDPIGQPVIGFKKSLSRIQVEDATGYYRRYYTPDNAYALVVGGVDPLAAAALVEETLGGWERGDPRPPLPAPPRPAPDRAFLFKTLTHQVYYGTGVLTDGEQAPERPAIDLLARILGGGKSSRLVRRIVESEGLTEDFDVQTYSLSNIGVLAGGGAVDPAKAERFKAILADEIARLAREPVDPSELDLAKGLLRADVVREFESNEGIAGFRGHRLLYRQDVSRDAWAGEVERLGPEDLLAAARKSLAPDKVREVEIQPARGFGKVMAVLRYLLFRRI
jgi:zinc protease